MQIAIRCCAAQRSNSMQNDVLSGTSQAQGHANHLVLCVSEAKCHAKSVTCFRVSWQLPGVPRELWGSLGSSPSLLCSCATSWAFFQVNWLQQIHVHKWVPLSRWPRFPGYLAHPDLKTSESKRWGGGVTPWPRLQNLYRFVTWLL